jgi:cell wall-associated NlpC family hydrolase
MAPSPDGPGPVTSVPSASGAVLAEMNARLGTPRRVAISARKRARLIARIEARIRAQERAAAARRAAARARAAAGNVASAPIWFDAQAAANTTSAPATPDEAQWLNSGRGGWVEANGYARAPVNAPDAIRRVMQAGNLIARSPYIWGGGHGAWLDKGYDCSGSVSYALHGAGLISRPRDSGEFMRYGEHGRGAWVTIRANSGHAYMIVAGLRFDTSASKGGGSRWTDEMRSAKGYRGVHPDGL